jgi:serine/threonine-protein kinase
MKAQGRMFEDSGSSMGSGGTEPIDAAGDDPAPFRGVETGMILGQRYQLGPVLGSGGAGRVFSAFDRVLNERVALKVLRWERAGDRRWIRRLAREVKIARLIRHPNVCRVFEMGSEDGHWFVTMELADGGTLRDVLRRREAEETHARLPAFGDAHREERRAEARAVCAGLAAIHAVGIVHRDVTPQNVLRMGDGRLVLSDFGLAIAAQESTTFLGGTPRYMAPEVVAGRRADQRSDVYQLGLVLHEIVFGRRAEWHDVGGQEILRPPVDQDVSTPVEEELAALCADCLLNDPSARPPNAVAVAGRLAAAEQARPRGLWARTRRRAAWITRSGVARFAAGAVALLAIGAGVGSVALRPRPCSGGPVRVEAVWGPASKEAMGRGFAASGEAWAPAAFANVTRLIDDHVRRWLAAYADACEATVVRGEQSAEVLDLRMACLNDDLDSVAALTRVLTKADATVVGHAVAAAGHLDDLGRCADLHRLRSTPPLPADPIIRRSIAEQFERLTEAGALYEAGRYGASQTVIDKVVDVAEHANYCPLTSRALAAKGLNLVQVGLPGPAYGIFKKATYLAEFCGDDRSFALAASGLVSNGSSDTREAKTWFELGMAAVKHAGGDGQIEAWLLNNLGIRRYGEGAVLDSLRLFEQAVALKETRYGRDALDTQFSLENMALPLARLGRLDEAISDSNRAVGVVLKLLGEHNFAYINALAGHGTVLLATGRRADARVAFERVLQLAAEELPPDHWVNAEPLAGLGRIAYEQHDPRTAIDLLTRALSLAEPDGLLAPELADVRLALARALDEARHDRKGSRKLARQALEVYGRSPDLDSRRQEAQRWLDDHPSARDTRAPRSVERHQA